MRALSLSRACRGISKARTREFIRVAKTRIYRRYKIAPEKAHDPLKPERRLIKVPWQWMFRFVFFFLYIARLRAPLGIHSRSCTYRHAEITAALRLSATNLELCISEDMQRVWHTTVSEGAYIRAFRRARTVFFSTRCSTRETYRGSAIFASSLLIRGKSISKSYIRLYNNFSAVVVDMKKKNELTIGFYLLLNRNQG